MKGAPERRAPGVCGLAASRPLLPPHTGTCRAFRAPFRVGQIIADTYPPNVGGEVSAIISDHLSESERTPNVPGQKRNYQPTCTTSAQETTTPAASRHAGIDLSRPALRRPICSSLAPTPHSPHPRAHPAWTCRAGDAARDTPRGTRRAGARGRCRGQRGQRGRDPARTPPNPVDTPN